MHMLYGGFGFGGMILPMLIWLLVVTGIIYLVSRWFGGPNRWQKKEDYYHSGGGESALEILKRRYAAGELTTEEYIAMKEEIKG